MTEITADPRLLALPPWDETLPSQEGALDERIIRVGFEVRGQLKVYENLAIICNGTKYSNSTQNTCQISIANLDRDTRDYLLTECNPFNKNNKPKKFFIDVGRKSYGTFRLFEGDFAYCALGQSINVKDDEKKEAPKKPSKKKKESKSADETGDVSVDSGDTEMDIWVTFKALTGDSQKSRLVSRSGLPVQNLSEMARQTAADLGLSLDFSATDKQLSNTSYTGSALQQVDDLETAGAVSVYIDDGKLVVKDINLPLPNFMRVLNFESGMVGKPEFTEQGCKVKFLIDPRTKLGGALKVISKTTPTANGVYIIYKLSFFVASRDVDFYYAAETTRYLTADDKPDPFLDSDWQVKDTTANNWATETDEERQERWKRHDDILNQDWRAS